MRLLITGICGFVGSQLALGLQQRIPHLSIAGIDNFIRPGAINHHRTLKAKGIRVLHGDLRSASDLDAVGPVDWVIDAAANPSVLAGSDGRTSTRQLLEHNLWGTVNILEFCKQHRAGFVLLSTSRVYNVLALASLPLKKLGKRFVLDSTAKLPAGCSEQGVDATFSTAAPITLYGASKLASEVLALEMGIGSQFPVIVNRCGVMAGAGQLGTAEQGIFSYWIRAYALHRPIRYIGFDGSGAQVRDAMHPDDLADLLIAQWRDPAQSTGIWNVGGGPNNSMSLAELSDWCSTNFGAHDVISDTRPRPMDVPWLVMDSRTTSEKFDWKPRRALPSILDEIAAHHRQQPDWLDQCAPW